MQSDIKASIRTDMPDACWQKGAGILANIQESEVKKDEKISAE